MFIRNKFFLLTATIVFAFMSQGFAQFAGGNGTDSDPYQVATAEHLNNVRNFLSASFIQTANLDLGVAPWNIGEGWMPVGSITNTFGGKYNGNSYTVLNLYINRPDSNYVGLFGHTTGSTLTNISVSNANVTGYDCVGSVGGQCNYSSVVSNCSGNGSINGYSSVGGVIGYVTWSSYVDECSFIGDVYGYMGAGGVISTAHRANGVSNSYFIGNVSVNPLASGDCATGGVAAYLHYTSVSNCFSIANVTGAARVGGVVGWNNDGCSITNCFASGSVSGSSSIGGIVGYHKWYSSVNNSYYTGTISGVSEVGGVVGTSIQSSSVSNSYWNTQTSNVFFSSGGEGRTTDEMTYPYASNTYVGWDFTNVWHADNNLVYNNGYPYLVETINQPPNAAVNPIPADLSIYINTLTSLQWTADTNQTTNPPTAFRIWLGTDNPPTNLLNGVDIGNVNSYQPHQELESQTTYYWQVVPSNPIGVAQNCPIWSFTTFATYLIASPDSSGVNYGVVYLGDSGTMQLTLNAIGTEDITISQFGFYQNPTCFSVNPADVPVSILRGVPTVLNISFHPTQARAYNDTLYIYNNSTNRPVFKIKLSGVGEYVPPQAPQNVSINIDGFDALITWDAVTQNIYDTPISVPYYFIYGSVIPNPDATQQVFLGYSVGTTFRHLGVGLPGSNVNSPREFFYTVTAVVWYPHRENSALLNVMIGMSREDVISYISRM